MLNFAADMNQRDRQILQIALPSIVSNITVPLLGMIDVAIVGHMGSPVYIGAVAVGSMIFNLVYWLFGFLRMGSSGLTAQALGRRDFAEITRLLVRSVSIAFGIALLMIVFQGPLKWLMFWLISPTTDVARPVQSDGLVYRHAEHPHPDAHQYHAECGQHPRFADTCLWLGHED